MTTSSGSSGGSSSSSSSSSDSPKKSGVGSASRSGPDGGVVKTMSNPDSITHSSGSDTGSKTNNLASGFLGTDLQKQNKPGTTVAPIAGSFAGSSMGGGGSDKVPGAGAEVPTTVAQPTSPGASDGPESTTVTGNPRSDFSAVLAGLLGRRPNRGAARSNNFISLVGSAGGLGRATATARRSLIGGA